MAISPASDPSFLPFKLDLEHSRLLFLQLDRAQRAEAAFLDERAVPAEPNGVWYPLSAVPVTTVAQIDFIFHIGHCGSTLLSRLLATWPEAQVLREPLPLRTLAAADPVQWALLRPLLALWSRPLPPATRTMIKATSGCNDLIPTMLEAAEGSRGVLLDMPLPAYLSTLLKAPSSISDVAASAQRRARFLHRHLGQRIATETLSAPEMCAMSWTAEQLRFHQLTQSPQGSRLLRVDFEALIADPSAILARIAAHLRLDAELLPAAISSPAWGRYAKATQHVYGVDDRAHDLSLSRRRFGPQIDAGIRWAAEFAGCHTLIAAALRAGGHA